MKKYGTATVSLVEEGNMQKRVAKYTVRASLQQAAGTCADPGPPSAWGGDTNMCSWDLGAGRRQGSKAARSGMHQSQQPLGSSVPREGLFLLEIRR